MGRGGARAGCSLLRRCRRRRTTPSTRWRRRRNRRLARRFDAALVDAAHNAEVPLLAPERVPRVCHLPVLGALLDTPPHKLDGMAASGIAGHVVVDAARVILKVGVDGEGGLDRATLHDHLLHLLHARRRLRARVRDLSSEKDACEPAADESHDFGHCGERSDGQPGSPSAGYGSEPCGPWWWQCAAWKSGKPEPKGLDPGTAAGGRAGARDVRPRRRDRPPPQPLNVSRSRRPAESGIWSVAFVAMHPVGRRLGAGERPAAAAVRLVADVADRLGARGERLGRVEVVGATKFALPW